MMHAILEESYYIHKAAWQWTSLKVQKGHIKFVWYLDVDNIPVKLQHDMFSYIHCTLPNE